MTTQGGLSTGRGFVREIGAAVAIVAACLAWRFIGGGSHADAQPPRTGRAAPAAPATPSPANKPMALVNGSEVTSERLSAECLSRFGSTVLEALVNRVIIEQACSRAGITITPQDVETEIDVMSRRFNVPRDKWLELIQQERGVTKQQYAEDIVWPMLALRRLANGTIEPTAEELQESFEKVYGPAIKARIIVSRTRADAETLRAQALATPDEFPALARQHSVDVGSASANGWVQPIRLHSGDPAFDRAAFALEPGEVSPVVQVADQFIIIRCEGHLPAADVTLDDARPQLAEQIRERKSRQASTDVFRTLQEQSTIENVLNDPQRSAALPGVAAIVNGQPVPLERVREVALERHGREVLEILITRTLIEQSLAREKVQISQADIDAEVARAAEAMGFHRPDGSPDVAGWLAKVTQDEKVPMRHYVEDVVWPTVALKKLVGAVPVLQDDLDKAFAATFGPRARCRIIVLDSQRRAQEVWQQARQNPTAEHVGNLAETYSVDPTTKALRGEVPPIQRWGGQPAIEREAFALKPGELSGVVQVADRFMVIFCEGFTAPAEVSFAEVRDELYGDIHEKKQRVELARYFSHMREAAAIDNFLAGTSQTPVAQTTQAAGRAGVPPSTLTKTEADELARPRAGSRRAAPAVPPASSGVVPAGLEQPVR